jgi:hypothetical protein
VIPNEIMMPSIDEEKLSKNTEIIGISVGGPIKTISSQISPLPTINNSDNSVKATIDPHESENGINESSLINNKITINPSSSPESESLDQDTINGTNLKLDEDFLKNEERQCGWFRFKPKCLERFMSPKWALFWLCCSSWTQGGTFFIEIFIQVSLSFLEIR